MPEHEIVGEVIEVPIESIIIGDRFRKEMGDMEDMILSIRDKGVIQPISVGTDYKLLAGERRIRASVSAGKDTIPVIFRSVEGEIDYREIELIENVCRKDLDWHERDALEKQIFELKREKAGWTQKQTAQYLNESAAGLSRHLQIAEAIQVMPELKEFKTEDEAWKAIKKMEETVALKELSKRSDTIRKSTLQQVIESSFILGDSLKGMKMVEDKSFAFAEVDPPYGINLKDLKRQPSFVSDLWEYVEVDAMEYSEFILASAKEVYRLLKSDSFAVWWFGPTHWVIVKVALSEAGFNVYDIPAIWLKGIGQTQQPQYNLASAYEPFFICRKGNPMLSVEGRINVFDYPFMPAGKKIHPTQRPIELIHEILRVFTPRGSHVLCPFLGSGTTIKAAYHQGMSCLGWDLSEEYRQKAILTADE